MFSDSDLRGRAESSIFYVSYVLTAGYQQVSLGANYPQILVSEYAVRNFRRVILTQKLRD